MANKQYNLYLDLSGSSMVPHIEIRRNDYDSNSFIVQVTQGGAPLDFTGMAPIFECLTPDGHYIRDDGSQYGTFTNVNAAAGTFEYTLVSEVFAVLGQIDIAYFAFEQAVTGAENPTKRLSTGNFTFSVIADALTGTPAAQDYMSDVTALINDINQIKADYQTLNPANYAATAQLADETTNRQSADATLQSEKADQTYVDTVLASVTSGGPDEIFYSISALNSAYPSGASRSKLVFDSSFTDGAHSFLWNGSSWQDVGVYQGTAIANGSINEPKTTFFDETVSKNLYDGTYSSGYMNNTGTIQASAQYGYTKKISVMPGKIIVFSKDSNGSRVSALERFITAFDASGNPVPASGDTTGTLSTYTVPNGIASIVISFDISFVNFQIESTDDGNFTSFEAYFNPTYKLKSKYNQILMTDLDPILQDIVSNKMQVSSKNKYNKNAVTQGHTMGTDGSTPVNANYCYTDFIPVNPGDIVAITIFTTDHNPLSVGSRFITAFDASKTVIPSSGVSTDAAKKYIVPAGVYFIVCTFNISYFNNNLIQIETTANGNYTEYAPFFDTYYVIKNDVVGEKNLDIFLPADIYCAVGRTIELYNNQVCLQSNEYHMNWKCTIGKNLGRKFSVAGTVPQIGTYDLTLEIIDDNLNIIWTGTTNLHIIASSVPAKMVCPIGDSLTNNKNWLAEVMTLSSGNISFVGTRNFQNADSSGTVKSGKQEGRSGFAAADYLAATTYAFENEGVQPFWNPSTSRFDWNYYKSSSGVSPDAVQLWLGINGIALDNADNAGSIKKIVDYIRQDDATIPVYIVYTLFKGNQNGIGVQQSTDGYAATSGQYKYSEDKKVMDLISRLYDLLKLYSNVYFVPCATCHDSENNFGAVVTPVNPRASQTELMPTEGTHPQLQGYFQIADIIFSTFCGTLS